MNATIDKDGCLVITAATELEWYSINRWFSDNICIKRTTDYPNISCRPTPSGLCNE